jgi:hypothetical protein
MPDNFQMNPATLVVAAGGIGSLKSRELRFLEEAAKLGDLTVWLWPDDFYAQNWHPQSAP